MSGKRLFFCPICRTEVERGAPDFPFCSARCRLIDLGNWSGEEYKIPGEQAPLPDDEPLLH